MCSDKFIKIISELGGNILLICDEVHWVGADIFQKGLLPIFKYRLGLSATPERYMDEEGSDIIKDYFGKVVYEFSLKRALTEINPATGETFLCPYNYYPVFVELDSVELEGYLKLTEEIKKQYAMERKLERNSSYYQRLCEKRQAIITNAEDKYRVVKDIIRSLKKAEFLLIYCSP
ncbi:MAG: hypothetical protein Q7J27_00875 [Syntrophales bacterium]|nr:hypothetical protein [Syntrophales bacterium]